MYLKYMVHLEPVLKARTELRFCRKDSFGQGADLYSL